MSDASFVSGPLSGILSLAVFGFTGSLHCAGMCGAIAASTSRRGNSKDILFYHVSRIIAYAFLGFLFGLLSASLLGGFPKLAEFHGRYLGALLGSVMIFYGFRELAIHLKWLAPKGRSRVFFWARKLPFTEPVVLGLATALLPCGFLYAAFLQSALLAQPVYSAFGMAIFGVATGPALGFGGVLLLWLQKWSPRLVPWVSSLALGLGGVFLIWRGIPSGHHHHESHPPHTKDILPEVFHPSHHHLNHPEEPGSLNP